MNNIERFIENLENGRRQYRDLTLEIREEGKEEPDYIVQGYATTYNQPYYLYKVRANDGYTIEVREEVDRHAFDEADIEDCIMQYDHQGRIFARVTNNTLSLNKDDEKGLFITADLGGTEIGRQLYEEIKGGYTNKMSFGFTIEKKSELRQIEPDNKSNEMWVYTIEKVGRLYDVSAVSLPQNDFTSISARSLDDGEIRGEDVCSRVSAMNVGNGEIFDFIMRRKLEHERKVRKMQKIEELIKLIESED